MFTGNTDINTTKQNPGGAGALVVALVVAGIGYVGYRLLGKKAKTAVKPCAENQVWSHEHGECVPAHPGPPQCPEGFTWSEEKRDCVKPFEPAPGHEYYETNGYHVPHWGIGYPGVMTRELVGLTPVPEHEGQPFEVGRRFGMIVDWWPGGPNQVPDSGAEFIYVRNAGYTPPPPDSDKGPLDGTYRVQVLSKFQGKDVAPKHAAFHGHKYGEYITDFRRGLLIKVFPEGMV